VATKQPVSLEIRFARAAALLLRRRTAMDAELVRLSSTEHSLDIVKDVYTAIQNCCEKDASEVVAPFKNPCMKNVNSDLAYDYLKKRILSGEYPPGRSLMTNVLAPEIGVSRTPIRDALRQLEADGLVSIQPRLGASVKKMDLKAFRESCELRLALEVHAAGLAARQRAEIDLHEISLALEEMRRITGELLAGGVSSKLMPGLVREDVRFHLAIITAAKNDLIKKEILRLHLINRVVSSPALGKNTELKKEIAADHAHRREVLACHEEIYRAIAAGEVAAAKKAMEHHIQDIIDRTIHLVARGSTEVLARQLTEEEAIYTA
jgi:DNA-binding GntR family transcriptional regulator